MTVAELIAALQALEYPDAEVSFNSDELGEAFRINRVTETMFSGVHLEPAESPDA